MDDEQNVAIFWDYENCTPPSSVPGYDIVNNIREIAQAYGSVKLFKAYLELSEQLASPNSSRLRSELQSCGVSLTHCPHNGRKDVADKMMIVDMLAYAIDTPAPATLVVISGDRDLVYAVSVLRWRKYCIVLVAPDSAHCSLRSQASTTLDWEYDILGKTRAVGRQGSNTVADIAPAHTSNEGYHGRARSSTGPTPTPSTDSQQRDRRQSPRGLANDVPDVDRPEAAATTGVTSPSTRPISVLGVSNLNSFHVISSKYATQNIASSAPATPLQPAPMMSVSDPPPAPAKHTFPDAADLEDSGPTGHLETLFGGLPHSSGPTSHPATSTSSEEYNAMRRAPLIILRRRANVTNITTGNIDLLPQELEETKPTIINNRISADLHRSTLSSNSSGSPTPADTMQVNGENSQQRALRPLFRPEDHVLCGSGTPSRCTAPPPHVQCRFGFAEPPKPSPTPISTVSPSPPFSISSTENRFLPVSRIPVGPTSSGWPSQAQPSPSEPELSPVPPAFKTLIGLLEKHRAYGVLQPLSDTVACALVERDRAAYKLAGAQDWNQYARLAVKVGIIKLGGAQVPWLSLEPAWYGRVTLPSR